MLETQASETSLQAPIRPGGFWARFLATWIDQFLLSIASWVIFFAYSLTGALLVKNSDTVQLLAFGFSMLTFFGIELAYYGYFYSTTGQTLGKKALGLKVVHFQTGELIDYKTTALRELLGKMLCSFTLGIGFVMAAFRADKRGLHDLVADTRVIRVG